MAPEETRDPEVAEAMMLLRRILVQGVRLPSSAKRGPERDMEHLHSVDSLDQSIRHRPFLSTRIEPKNAQTRSWASDGVLLAHPLTA